MIGKKLEPSLLQIEMILLEHNDSKPNYPPDSFRAITFIFMSAMMDKMYDLQNNENIAQEDRGAMATKCGEDLRKFVKMYTDIDTHNLFK